MEARIRLQIVSETDDIIFLILSNELNNEKKNIDRYF